MTLNVGVQFCFIKKINFISFNIFEEIDFSPSVESVEQNLCSPHRTAASDIVPYPADSLRQPIHEIKCIKSL